MVQKLVYTDMSIFMIFIIFNFQKKRLFFYWKNIFWVKTKNNGNYFQQFPVFSFNTQIYSENLKIIFFKIFLIKN